MKQLTITILLSILTVSCFGQKSQIPFKKEIPMIGGDYDLVFKLAKQKIHQLNLDNLENGFDSIQIRIWYDYSLISNRKLIVIKKAKNKYSAILYNLEVDWDYINLSETIIKKEIKELNPKSGWSSFMNKISDLRLETLPNMNSISGLIDTWTDGITYNVEFATRVKYRFYSYHVPEKFQDKFWQAGNMVKIINLMNNEFDLK